MNRSYAYSFDRSLAWDDIESSLLLALWAVEGLHGLSVMHLETEYSVNRPLHSCTISSTTEAGRDLNRIFTSLLLREFGDESFQVSPQEPAAAA